MNAVMTKTGKRLETIETFKGRIEAGGFTNIQEKLYELPVGDWAKSPILKEAGKFNKQHFEEGLGGYAMYVPRERKSQNASSQDWTDYWRDGSQQTHSPWQMEPQSNIPTNTRPTVKVLQLHRTLKKAESSILMHMRTRCILVSRNSCSNAEYPA